jgi:hypothetical protein
VDNAIRVGHLFESSATAQKVVPGVLEATVPKSTGPVPLV